ncbi:MAG: glycosyltransferase family 87 protein [Candidatus Gribaldobacteria bacterium]|nr:glycosyltransferase family 87 protein [Candidatus Gribaldobacteria bacterium]
MKTRGFLAKESWIVWIILLSLFYFFLVLESYQMDFRGFYVAGKSFSNGLNPYLNNIAISPVYFDSNNFLATSRFIYPPIALFLFAPLALLPYFWAKLVFSFLIGVCLFLVFYLLKKRFDIKTEFLLLIFLSFPIVASFERGQIDLLILLLVILAWFKKDKWYGGLFLATACVLKVYPVLLWIFFAVRKNWKIVISSGIFLATIFFSSLLFLPVGLFADFMGSLFVSKAKVVLDINLPGYYLDQATKTIVSPEGNFIFTHKFIHHSLNFMDWLGKYASLLAGCLLLVFSYFTRNKDYPEEFLFFSALVLMLLGNSALWIMGLVFYIPVSFYLLKKYEKNVFLCLLILLPLFLPNFIILFGYNLNYFVALLVLIYFFRLKTIEIFEHGV